MSFNPPGINPNLTPDSPGDALRSAIVAAIAANSTVTSLGAKVSRNSIPQRNSYPAVIVTKTNDTSDRDLDGLNGTSIASYSIAIVSTESTQVTSIRVAMNTLFEEFKGILSSSVNVDEVIKTNEIDLPEPPQNSSDKWVYRTVLDFEFSYRS